MKSFSKYVFIFSAITYIANQLIKLTYSSTPTFVSSHLNDILCMPVVLGIACICISKIKSLEYIEVSFTTTTFLTLYYAFIFEILLPHYSTTYTADFIDVLAYFTGAYLFYFAQLTNTPLSLSKNLLI